MTIVPALQRRPDLLGVLDAGDFEPGAAVARTFQPWASTTCLTMLRPSPFHPRCRSTPSHNVCCSVLSLRPPDAGGRYGNCLQQSLSATRSFRKLVSTTAHTVGCNCFKIFATPGSQNSVQTHSRQYEYGIDVEEVDPANTSRRCSTCGFTSGTMKMNGEYDSPAEHSARTGVHAENPRLGGLAYTVE